MRPHVLALASLLIVVSLGAAAQETSVRLYAAGSLRAAMSDVARAYTESGGPPIDAAYGASGLLRERIEKGEHADVFASADVGNPKALADAGKARMPVVFARNRLCALIARHVDVTTDSLLDRMLDPAIKLGTSTPKADPSGDYAWQLFEKAEALRPGAYATLSAKALQLTGGSSVPPPAADRSIYAILIADGRADIFLTYCTNARQAVFEVRGAKMIAIPESLAVGADYGLSVLFGAPPAAERFAAYVLSAPAQEILMRHGFMPVRMP